jgi:hypothetical protein
MEDKYEKMIELLKRSEPVLKEKDELVVRIMRSIKEERVKVKPAEIFTDILFGWVYIGWMRRVMVTFAALIIIFFAYEQAVIMKRINVLSGKSYIESGIVRASMSGEIADVISRYKFFRKRHLPGEINVSEKEIDMLINSINDLQDRYRDIFELIENDPELKKYIELRINRIEISKPKI